MAIANDAQATFAASSVGSDPYSWNHTVGSISDGVLVVMVGVISVGSAPVGVTADGNDISGNLIDSWTPSPRPGVWAYYYLGVNNETVAISVDFDSAYQGFGISASFSGVDQTTPIGNTNDFGDFFGNNPSTAVSSATGERVVDVIAVDDGDDHTTPTDDEGQALATVLGSAGAGGASLYGASSWESGAASVTCSWSLSASDSVAGVAFALQPASGGGGATTHGPLAGPGGLASSGGLAGGSGILARSMNKLNGIWRPDRRLLVPVGISLRTA